MPKLTKQACKKERNPSVNNKRVILMFVLVLVLVLFMSFKLFPQMTHMPNVRENGSSIIVKEQRQQHQKNGICTAELLLEGNGMDVDADSSVMGSSNITAKQISASATTTTTTTSTKQSFGWQFSNESGEWRWLVPDRGQRACGLGTLSSSSPFLKPLQSTPHDIQAALSKKWLLLIGDSSVRMLHDYLVGRWLGGYTHWPKGMTNHGPKEHTRRCTEADKKIRPFDCSYDVFFKGARLTFVWFALDLSEELQHTIQQTIGSPDMVVAQHGYWDRTSQGNKAEAGKAPKKITNILDHREMESLYPRAYNNSQQRSIDDSSSHNNSNSTTNQQQQQQQQQRNIYKSQKRVWMSFFDSVYGPYDGSKEAKELGWEIFDRTKLVGFDGTVTKSAHPMNEILELELEVLLVLINETATKS